jgi:hypothetical protein
LQNHNVRPTKQTKSEPSLSKCHEAGVASEICTVAIVTSNLKNKQGFITFVIMSLFKSREWWSTNCGIDETFGAVHMCIANYESAISGVVKQIIIVGSLQGFLRIYDPQPPSSSSADENSCSSTDLQLETQLALPILAILSGRFNK